MAMNCNSTAPTHCPWARTPSSHYTVLSTFHQDILPWWISLTSWLLILLKMQANPLLPPVTTRFQDWSNLVCRMQFIFIGWANVWTFSMLRNQYLSTPSWRLEPSRSLQSWLKDLWPLCILRMGKPRSEGTIYLTVQLFQPPLLPGVNGIAYTAAVEMMRKLEKTSLTTHVCSNSTWPHSHHYHKTRCSFPHPSDIKGDWRTRTSPFPLTLHSWVDFLHIYAI